MTGQSLPSLIQSIDAKGLASEEWQKKLNYAVWASARSPILGQS
jgi:hypothetical protein